MMMSVHSQSPPTIPMVMVIITMGRAAAAAGKGSKAAISGCLILWTLAAMSPCRHLHPPPPAVTRYSHCMEDFTVRRHWFFHNRHRSIRHFAWSAWCMHHHLSNLISNVCKCVWRKDGTQSISTNGWSTPRRTTVRSFCHVIQMVRSVCIYNACRHSTCLWL